MSQKVKKSDPAKTEMLQQKCIDSIKGSSPETPSLTKQGKASREEVIVDLGFGK